jgi:hypothetical protein
MLPAPDMTRITGSRAHPAPPAVNMPRPCCPSPRASLWEVSGRPVSAKFRKPRHGALAVPAHEKEWSRGCRRAPKSFWSWLWPLSWQPAHRKRRSLHRKSPSSRPRPASTSDLTARAWRFSPAGPAPYQSLPLCGPRLFPKPSSAGSLRPLVAVSADLACGPARSPVRC